MSGVERRPGVESKPDADPGRGEDPDQTTHVSSDPEYPSSLLGAALGSAPPPIAIGAMVGPFRIVRELGRGGGGTVYLAQQSTPARMVALKWCLDLYGSYGEPMRPGSGERDVPATRAAERAIRGGDCHTIVGRSRVAGRCWLVPESLSATLGFRPARRLDR